MNGYEIKQFKNISTAKFCIVSFGSIYPALKRMENKDMVISTEIVDGGKYKKIN